MRVTMAAVLVCVLACDSPTRPLSTGNGSGSIRKGVCYSPCVISVTYAPTYVASVRMTDLGLLPGDSYSQAWGVNDAGQIVGVSVRTGTLEAVSWNTPNPSQIKALFPGVPSEARGINASGMITGSTTVTSNGTSSMRGFLWNNGAVTDLAYSNPQVSGYSSAGYSLNDSGTVAGEVYANFADGTNEEAMAYWPAGSSLAKVPAIESGETFPGTSQSQGNGINNSGMIAGIINGSAFLWQNGQWASTDSLPGSGWTQAMGVNDSGAAAATALLNSNTGPEHALLIRSGGITDLGTLRPSVPSASSRSWNINGLGLVVGSSDDSIPAGVGQSPFLWGTDFGMYRLPSFPGTTNPAGQALGANPHLLGDSILVVGTAYAPSAVTFHATLWSVTLGLQPVLIISPGIWALPRPIFYWDSRYTTDPRYDRYVRVVFFGGPNFNAGAVDASTLLLNHTKVFATQIADVNKDGVPDLVMLYSMRQLIKDGSFTQRTINATITGNLMKIGTPLQSAWPVAMCFDAKSCLPDDTVTGF